jgi:hypothetical protein
MNRVLYIALIMMIFFTLMPITLLGQDMSAVSEDEQTRLGKDEITKLMIQVERVPVVEQNRKMDLLWTDKAGDKTPRSDFLFCAGMAYMGNYKAQAYLGRAFEIGKGIVTDPYESYVWYSIALGNPIDDQEARQKIQSDRDRVKQSLVSVYPSPSDQELDELVKARKQEMTECLAEIRNARF